MEESTEVKHTEIIGGADGPTSIFFVDKSQKLSLSQRVQQFLNKTRRHYIEKKIVPGVHTIEEVEEYLKNRHGFIEVDKTDPCFIAEYEQMRTTSLFEHRPDLVEGQVIDFDPDSSDDQEEIIRQLEEKINKEREIAESIPREVFDIDYHKYVKTGKDINESMHIDIERNYGYFAGGAGGSKTFIRKWRKIYKEIYMYYGVSEDDIRNKTQRYKNLVVELSLN